MKRTCLTLVCLVALSQAAMRLPQVEQGFSVGVGRDQPANHILQSGNQKDRYMDVEVKFKQAFKLVPKVALAMANYEVTAGNPYGYDISLQQVSKEGFTARISSRGTTTCPILKFNWMATDDPSFHVQYFNTQDTGETRTVKAGATAKRQNHDVAIVGWKPKNNPSVVAFLIGVVSADTIVQWLKIDLDNSNKESTRLYYHNYGRYQLLEISACLVYYDQDPNSQKLFTFGQTQGGLLLQSGQQADQTMKYSDNFDDSGDVILFYGNSGENTGPNKSCGRISNGRLNKGGKQIIVNSGMEPGCLGNQHPSFFVYKPTEFDFVNSNCAYLYTECGYKGNSLEMCGKTPNFDEAGFDGPIKSIQVPAGRSVTFYNEANFEGKKVVISESRECIQDGLKVSFFQRSMK